MTEEELRQDDWALHQLIYSIIVAGKSAEFARAAIQRLFQHIGTYNLRASITHWMKEDVLRMNLEHGRTGNYTKLERAIKHIIDTALDPVRCTLDDLEAVPGIGPKTARFFLLWTRPTQSRYAALDVHVLRWLREQGYDAPRQTPANRKKYAVLEQAFLTEAKKRNQTPAQLDAEIWEAGQRAYREGRRETECLSLSLSLSRSRASKTKQKMS